MKLESPIMKRLGTVPFWRGEKRCVDELSRIYRLAMENSRTLANEKRKSTRKE